MMKKWILSLGIVAISGNIALAQANNVRKVKASVAKFEELGGGELGMKFLKDVVEPIEQATQHEKTKEDPETWTLYALVFSNLAFGESNDAYATKAVEGVKKAQSLDKDKKNAGNIESAIVNIRNHYQTTGYKLYQENNFKGAIDEFAKGISVNPSDTTLIYFSGVSAVQIPDYATAVKYYELLVPMKEYADHKTVMGDLPKLYLSLKDTAKAISKAAEALKMYPNDNDIAVQNIEINLMTGNEAKVIADIEKQIEKDSNNKTLYYYLGIAYSASDNTVKALESYKKAVAIDPNYTDCNLNIAAIIMNESNGDLMALNDNKNISNDNYKKALEVIRTKMGEAVPYLENAIAADPSNRNALVNLKGYYDFINNEAKAAEVQAKIDKL